MILNPAVGQGLSMFFWGCRARRNNAEWRDREGRSSTFQRKVRPRGGMQASHNNAVGHPLRCAIPPRATLWGAPFEGVATQSCTAKKLNLPCSELTKKVKVKCRKKTL
jgi:hypothetical protein